MYDQGVHTALATKKTSPTSHCPQFRYDKQHKFSQSWTQMQANSARRRSHACWIWRRKPYRSGPVDNFRAQHPSLLSLACCRLIIRRIIKVFQAFFLFCLRYWGVSKKAYVFLDMRFPIYHGVYIRSIYLASTSVYRFVSVYRNSWLPKNDGVTYFRHEFRLNGSVKTRKSISDSKKMADVWNCRHTGFR